MHHGNFALELGNPELQPEQALGFDVSLRWRGSRASGEITYFRNDINDFIFKSELEHEDFEAREDEFWPGSLAASSWATTTGGRRRGGGSRHRRLRGADAVLQGVEAHADFQVASNLFAEFGADYVRGSLKATDDALPRIPPFRLRGGLRYQKNAFQAGGQIIGTAKQERVYGAEGPTAGYGQLKLFASYSFTSGAAVNTITARLDNATNELYRNHLSYIKELVPEMGRNFKLLYNVKF